MSPQELRNSILSSERTGTQTNVSGRELASMPTISRSITDFTKYTPQAQGNSFGGSDGRFNTITVDGAAFNNNFGLSTNALPGGEAQPISLDAIEEISVNIAPYDVRMSQFTGASINAVTRSGDNEFKGSVYTYNVRNHLPETPLTEMKWPVQIPGASQTSASASAAPSSRINSSSSSAVNMKTKQSRV